MPTSTLKRPPVAARKEGNYFDVSSSRRLKAPLPRLKVGGFHLKTEKTVEFRALLLEFEGVGAVVDADGVELAEDVFAEEAVEFHF